jgi:hypothetical protein
LPKDFHRDRRARHDEKREQILATTADDRVPDEARADHAALTRPLPALRGFFQENSADPP